MIFRYEVAIPSYHRAETLARKTLSYLARARVDPGRITIFVADEPQSATYKDTLFAGTYGRVVVAVPGIRAVRNFIHHYYPPGTPVLGIDDDINSVVRAVDRKHMVEVAPLDPLVADGFHYCQKAGARLWGINPVANPYFMRPQVSTDLRYIVACCYGWISNQDSALDVTLDDKEDYERSIKYFAADGAVVRLNHVAPKTRYYVEPGGMQIERTPQRIRWSAQELVRRYPQYCAMNTAKKSAYAEVRLFRQPKMELAASG